MKSKINSAHLRLSQLIEKNDNANFKISNTGIVGIPQISPFVDNKSHSNNNPQLENKQNSNRVPENQTSSPSCNFSLNKFTELKSHLDVVRKLAYLPTINSLVSVSEDCLIKVWSLNNINYNSQNNDLEPYLVLRGHTGPLFCLETSNDDANIIYTAGNEGVIKIWKLPKQEEVQQYGDSDIALNCNIGFFQKEINEVVWELKHHPQNVSCITITL